MKYLFILFAGLTSILASAQNTVIQENDFSRRPHFYQGKTITLKNVVFNVNKDGAGSARGQMQQGLGAPTRRAPQRPMRPTRVNRGVNPNTPQHGLNDGGLKGLSEILYQNPRCRVRPGWVLVQPHFEGLTTPMCFAVINRVGERLPKGEFAADITMKVDVRGVSEIQRLRILR